METPSQPFEAVYDGECAWCLGEIEAGEYIVMHCGAAYHATCMDEDEDDDPYGI